MTLRFRMWAKRLKGPKRNPYRMRQAEAFGRAIARDIMGRPKTHGLNPITAGYEGACAVVKPKSPKPNTPGEA